MKKIFVLVLILFLSICSGCSSTGEKKVELTVSAATSLQDVLYEIKTIFEKEHPSIKIAYNFGSSGALQQQISQGAPVDLFFSASEEKFTKLVDDGFIENQSNVVGNELVLIIPKEKDVEIQSFLDLNEKIKKISIGIPESVPAGMYAKETLEKLDLWSVLEGKIVYAKDVRQVLTYVETKNVDAGIVYQTDALQSNKVNVVTQVDKDLHSNILYPIGVIKSSKHQQEANLFDEFIKSEDAFQVFARYGFSKPK